MIPIFPQFKKLELSDRDDVEQFTSKLPPYSDFAFVSMWLWDHDEETLVSRLNGNLVVRLTDSRTQETFHSFIGTSKCAETASKLLGFLKSRKQKPELRLVPGHSVSTLGKERFSVSADRDNFDYILCVKELSEVAGKKFEPIRTHINALERNGCEFMRLDISDKAIQKKVSKCFESWITARSIKQAAMGSMNAQSIKAEHAAFERLLALDKGLLKSMTCFGVFVDGVLDGVLIGEIIGDHWLCHFSKANYKHKGIFQTLHQRTARALREHGILYLNMEEDMGLPSLRFAKSRYRPVHFLKKYTVNFSGDGCTEYIQNKTVSKSGRIERSMKKQ